MASGLGNVSGAERLAKGYTLRQLAERLRWPEAKLSNIENDKVVLDLDELAQITGVLEV